jgi:NADPH:quinone reductase-like Zn-dependent oxidoreductase
MLLDFGRPAGRIAAAVRRESKAWAGRPSVTRRANESIRCAALWFTNKSATFAFARKSREELLALKDMIESGRIVAIVDRILAMDQAAGAHRLVEAEQRRGAIAIVIGDCGSRSA